MADQLEHRVSALEERMGDIETDITEIRSSLAQTATKFDLANLKSEVFAKIDESINGLLKDALRAMPAKHANMLMGLMLVVSVCSLVAGLAHWR